MGWYCRVALLVRIRYSTATRPLLKRRRPPGIDPANVSEIDRKTKTDESSLTLRSDGKENTPQHSLSLSGERADGPESSLRHVPPPYRCCGKLTQFAGRCVNHSGRAVALIVSVKFHYVSAVNLESVP